MENVREHRDIKPVANNRRCHLMSEPNYQTTKSFSQKLLAIKINITEVKTNKPLYLGLSILDISETAMYDIGMTIQKDGDKDKLFYI